LTLFKFCLYIPPELMTNVQYSIKVAARRSGLSPHVIRVWERRYNAVEPARTGTNRRLYSDAEIERLNLLRHAIAAGHRIGNIAHLPVMELKRIVGESIEESSASVKEPRPGHEKKSQRLTDECLAAVQHMDPIAFEEALTRGLLLLGHQGLLKRIAGPLVHAIGESWAEGTLTAAHEHFASAQLRVFLGHTARPFAHDPTAPHLVIATPSGQLHELGAVMIASAARNAGWNVAFLGAALPAPEIAGAAIQKQARAVALSIVYPADDPALPGELSQLRRLLPEATVLIIGGRAAAAYRPALQSVNARWAADLDEFCRLLDLLRSSKSPPDGSAV
jgi:DNA-binding transcriptional MerR regulator/methylmalonyl-CoA mutase cobalamin-binding subunit